MLASTLLGGVLADRIPQRHVLLAVALVQAGAVAVVAVSLSLMPLSMALAGPASGLIGSTATFLVAGLAPPVLAVVAILAARLPSDEVAHPLDVPAPRRREPEREGGDVLRT